MDDKEKNLVNLIKNNNFNAFKRSLMSMSMKERELMVNKKIDGCSMFFTACRDNKTEFVEFMQRKCCADINQMGLYTAPNEVPPIWLAAENGNTRLVKLFVKWGASVHSTTDTNSTTLRAACYNGCYELALYLIEQGVDVNKRTMGNSIALTCAARHDISLCELLIDNGSLINIKDRDGKTPLTYAVEYRRLDLVKLFLSNGGDCSVCNHDGDSILRIAALEPTIEVLEYLIENSAQGKQEVIEAYELKGCQRVEYYDDNTGAWEMWRKAMVLRETEPKCPITKITDSLNISVFKGYSEPTCLSEFKDVYSDEDSYMQALVVRERVLGRSHRLTIQGINNRAGFYSENDQFRRMYELRKYAFDLAHEHFLALDDIVEETTWVLTYSTNMPPSIYTEKGFGYQLSSPELLEILEKIVNSIEKGSRELAVRPLKKNAEKNFHYLLDIVLYIVGHRLRLALSREENVRFEGMIDRISRTRVRTDAGYTLLHHAVDWKEGKFRRYVGSDNVPCLDILKCLIDNGFSVNTANGSMDTVMHLLINQLSGEPQCKDDLKIEELIKYILEQEDVHLDVKNGKGECPLKLLKDKKFPVCFVRDRSLACLAAETIIENSIPFVTVLPPSLKSFVDSHAGFIH